MTHVQELVKNLKAQRLKDKHLNRYPFITISRQSGAGGHNLATAIKAKTDAKHFSELFSEWEIFDYNICKAIVEDHNYTVTLQAMLAEKYHSEIQDFLGGFTGKPDEEYKIYREITSVMNALAGLGKVILVGRGGANVTRRQPGGIHIRLIADRDVRIKRMAEFFKTDMETAERDMDRQDRDRARMVRAFFSRDINDPSLYDEVWNTTSISNETLAEQAISLIEERAKDLDWK